MAGATKQPYFKTLGLPIQQSALKYLEDNEFVNTSRTYSIAQATYLP